MTGTPWDALVDGLADQVADRIRPGLIAAAESRTLPVLAVTVAEAAAALRLSDDTVYGLIRNGRLEVLTDVGRAQRVTVASLHAYSGHPLLPQLHEVAMEEAS